MVLPALLVCVGCGNPTPAPPVVPQPTAAETVTGSERLGWDQRASDNAELATIRYVVYVDGNRSELSGVTCSSTAGTSGYVCSARIPSMTAGVHTLEIASLVQDGAVFESARSAPLRVNVLAATTAATSAVTTDAGSVTRPPAQSTRSDLRFANSTRIATGLEQPSDLALLPDGRVLIAERTGRIRVVRNGALLSEPALAMSIDGGAVLAIAVDPDFARTRFVYAAFTVRARTGALTFAIARFREAGDTLGDRVILLDRIPASSDPHAALRFGPDRKLYAAFDSGGDARTVHDAASFNGKVLRLNSDGTTPRDQPGGTPVFLAGRESPRGFDWDRSASGPLWLADTGAVGSVAWPSIPHAVATHDTTIFIAAEAGLTQARLTGKTLAREQQIVDGIPVFAVAVAGDGRVYFATADALYLHVGKPTLLR